MSELTSIQIPGKELGGGGRTWQMVILGKQKQKTKKQNEKLKNNG